VAAQHGLVASLAPKPWPENAGNSCHIHFSLWEADGSRNRFHDASAADRLSGEARSFIAGVLAHLPGLCGLAAPSFNSYLRIVRLPATQAEALDALAADEVLTGALGPVLAESYLAVRRSEWEAYSAGDAAFEQQGHFSKY